MEGLVNFATACGEIREGCNSATTGGGIEHPGNLQKLATIRS